MNYFGEIGIIYKDSYSENGTNDRKSIVPKLSINADHNFPSLSNVLEINESDAFQSKIVAKTDIDDGQIVSTKNRGVNWYNLIL